MTTDPGSIDAILLKAIEFESADQRAAYLKQACGGDSALRRRVEILIADHFKAGDFLERPAIAPTIDGGPPVETAGSAIGPYKLLQVIGEGGMGVVYMAEQTEPVARRVALKIIKPGLDSGQIIARFEAERQALAMMDHPHIAKVLDAGTTDFNRPYFVMELVKGVPISDYCDAQQFSAKERLELFVKVCHAVQHAHQKGIIHRDLKPSNILVAEYDQQTVPKIIDFGVAKATHQKLTEKTMFTQYGQIVGTLEYMSPEQAKLNQLDIDTRSDVYSLGVLLYQLLTGTTPFQRERLQSAAFEEMLRIIREEEPPKPSTRISTLGKAAAPLSVQRRTSPQKLHQTVRGELDWIVMKALEKERSRRYESASGFAADVERYLSGEAVAACPPSASYRLRKFARRNWQSVTVAAMLLAALSVGLAGTSIGMARAQQAKRETTENLYYAQMNAAGRGAEEFGGIGQVRELVAGWDPEEVGRDLRGWEWFYLNSLCRRDVFTLQAHDEEVWSVAFGPDRKQLATASQDNTVKLWDVLSRELLFKLEGHTEAVTSVAWSPDGSRLASASIDKTVIIWDAVTRQTTRIFSEHKFPVRSVAWHPSGQLLASAGGVERWKPVGGVDLEVSVKVWEPSTGDVRHSMTGHTAPINAVCWSPDGQRLASASGDWHGDDQGIRVWNATTGAQELELEHVGRCQAVSWSPDARRLVSGSDGLKIWDVETGKEILALPNGTEAALCWSPDSTQVASAGEDQTVRIWDVGTGSERIVFRAASGIQSLSWSVDGELLASSNDQGVVQVWDAAGPPEPIQCGDPTVDIWDVSWAPDGRRLAAAHGVNGTVTIWDGANGRQLRSLEGHDAGVFSVDWSRDGEQIATAAGDGTITIWDVDTSEVVRSWRGHEQTVLRIRWSADSRLLAAASRDRSVTIWNPVTQDCLHELEGHTGTVTSICWGPKAEQLVSCGFNGGVRIWDIQTGEEKRVLRRARKGWLLAAQWSPDGMWIAAGGQGGSVDVWNAATGELFRTLSQTGQLGDLGWSPDSKRLATAAFFQGSVTLWNVTTGHQALTLNTKRELLAVRWSSDGHRLAAASKSVPSDNEAPMRVWNATAGYDSVQ